MRFRQSLIKTWMACPLQAKFEAIDNLPKGRNAKASFGTIVHFCLEQINKGLDVETTVDLFLDLWDNPEKLGVQPTSWPKYTTFGGLRTRGVTIIEDYARRLQWVNRIVIATEHHFIVPFGEHELEGTVDLLEVQKDQRGRDVLRIVDYKTNTRKPTFSELNLNIQFTAYVYASLQPEFWQGFRNGAELFEDLEDVERRAIWYHLWTSSEIEAGPRGPKDFERMYRVCGEIERAIKAGVFVPNISGDTCGFCPYHEPCGVSLPERTDFVPDETYE